MKPLSPPPRRQSILGVGAVLLTGLISTTAADWPQYRGPNLDGSTSERIAVKWPATGLRPLWKTPLTDGFSSFAVGGGRAYTLVTRPVGGVPREVCVAFDAQSGKPVWAAPMAIAKYDGGGNTGTKENKGGDGPRSTPTVDGDFVYAFSGRFQLACFEAATGKARWVKDLVKEHGGYEQFRWQNAASPLIEGNLVFVAGGGPGQALLGINKSDGKVVWKGQDDKATHSTPVAADILGVRQVIFFTQKGLVSVAPQTGAVLWRQSFPFNVSTAMTPIVAGDTVYCSAGYGVGAGAYRVSKAGNVFKSTELWRKPNELMNHWSTPVCKDGHLYGMFQFKEFGTGPLKCVELATGKIKWEKAGFGPGNVILAGDHILVLGDAGQLVSVEANPKAYTEVSRATVLAGKCWSTPVISSGRIYARSTTEGVCLDAVVTSARQ